MGMKAPGYSYALNKLLAKRRVAPRYLANFDSMSAMVRGTGRYLRGKELPGAGKAAVAARLALGKQQFLIPI